ncbi:M50 family metallopeptidase [Clostridium sp. HMP27]|uniref:M50 family metallopeptidase n=1 Tax=Clostridium sp. HMP27 TaxID=1487921 RepID=UPI00052DB316|nr:M50 family metallopeptidase [Clostridium sp. HMP27]KGK87261.1 membrane protein [Clostridium sp. HMP27]
MTFIIELLIRTCIETVYLTGMVILVGLLLGVLRNNSIKNFQRSFGTKAVMITGVIGVPIHELSHAIFALLFGHKITRIKLLQKPDEKGVMGYVQHSYNQGSIYQQVGNFFIGIAPIFGGAFSIIALISFIIPQAYNSFINILVKGLHVTVLNKSAIEEIINSYSELVKVIFSFKNFENPYFYVFLFIAICISSHISLSYADIKGASRGLGGIFLILLVLNALNLSKHILAIDLIKYNILITGVLIVALILSAVTFLISLISISIS